MRSATFIKLLALLATLALIAPGCEARIRKIRDPRDGSIRTGDTIAFDFENYFSFADVEDMSTVTCSVTQNTPDTPPVSIGHVYHGTDSPYYTYEYGTQFGAGNTMKYLDEKSFVVIASGGNVIYQETGVNGSIQQKGAPKSYSIPLLGTKGKCHDAITYGYKESYLVVGCLAILDGNTQALHLQVLDRTDFSKVSELQTFMLRDDLTDFRITTKLALRTFTIFDAQQNPVDYLLAYDQHRQHIVPSVEQGLGAVSNNAFALLFQVDADGKKFLQEYELLFKHTLDPNNDFAAIYDYYWWAGKFTLASRVYQPDGQGGKQLNPALFLAPCDLDLTVSRKEQSLSDDVMWVTKTLDCEGQLFATGVLDGHVTKLTGSNMWAIVDYKNLSLGKIDARVYRVRGSIDHYFAWDLQTNAEGIEIPKEDPQTFIANNWLREVQGDETNFVLKWATYSAGSLPQTDSDSYSTVILTDEGSVTSYPHWSVNVHSGFMYLYQLPSNHFAVVRITGFWWTAQGQDFNNQIDNQINLTCQEANKSSASAFATIHQIGRDNFRVAIQNWDPPYLEAYGGSTFRVPFGFNDFKAGNAIEFSVSFDNPIFTNPQVYHSFDSNINFVPGPTSDKKTWNNVLVNYDAAVTLDGTKLRFYTCDEQMGNVNCQMTGNVFDLYDTTTQGTYTLYKDMFSGYKMIAAAGRNHEGGVRKQGDTRIYLVSSADGSVTRTVDYYAESIAFSMDTENNFYVALSNYSIDDTKAYNPDESFVEVYKRTANQPGSWDKIAFIDRYSLDAVDDLDFCPGQLHFDPVDGKKLHILSHCGLKGDQVTRDKIYTQIIDASGTIHGHGQVLPFAIDSTYTRKVIPNFCPFDNHFVIYSYESQTVQIIEKYPTISVFNIPLSNWQLNSFDTFDCMPRIGMFALSSSAQAGSTGKINYGLFYGNQEYNADKYVNTFLGDLDFKDWEMIRSFPMKHTVLTVGYTRSSQVQNETYNVHLNSRSTLIEPPMIFASIGHMDNSFQEINTYNIKITASAGINKDSSSHTITAVKENTEITFKPTKKWSNATGWLNLETYTGILGPVKNISIAPTKSGQPKLQFRDRKWFRGYMDEHDEPTRFDVYRGNNENGVGLTLNKDTTVFSILTDHKIIKQFTIDGATAFDFAMQPQVSEQRLIVFNHQDEHEDVVRAFIIDNSGATVAISESSTGHRADKIRVKSFLGKFIVATLDHETMRLRVYSVNSQSQFITFTQVTSFRDVRDFDVVMGSSTQTLYVYYTKFESDQMQYAHVKMNAQQQWVVDVESSFPFDTLKRRWLSSIACRLNDRRNGSECAVNTFGTTIYTIDIAFPDNSRRVLNDGLVKFDTYKKLAAWEGDELFLTDQYLVQKAYHMSGTQRLSVDAIVWKRFPEGDGTAHTTIEINSGSQLRGLMDVVQSRFMSGKILSFENPRLLQAETTGSTAISAFYDSFYGHTVMVGSSDPYNPMKYFTLTDLMIYLPTDNSALDFTVYNINIEGSGAVKTVTVDQMLTGNVPDPNKDVKFWPFVMILGLLVIASISCFAYARMKSSKREHVEQTEGEEVYKTMQTDSDKIGSGTQFETGLNPNEEEDGLN